MMNFEKVILWRKRASERKRERKEKRECRREAKLNKKREQTKKRARANRERARILLSQLREVIVRVRSNALSLTGKENNRDESDRTKARRGRRSQKISAEGMLGFITITKQQTKNEKNRKAVLE